MHFIMTMNVFTYKNNKHRQFYTSSQSADLWFQVKINHQLCIGETVLLVFRIKWFLRIKNNNANLKILKWVLLLMIGFNAGISSANYYPI